MNLKEYLETHGISGTEFAKLIDVEPSAVSNYVTGYRFPRREIAARIVRQTKGQVPLSDIYAIKDAA